MLRTTNIAAVAVAGKTAILIKYSPAHKLIIYEIIFYSALCWCYALFSRSQSFRHHNYRLTHIHSCYQLFPLKLESSSPIK